MSRVLLVDDASDVREAIGQTPELAGFAVTAVRALIEAVDHLTPGFPGVVVTDIRMPGRDGFAMLGRVRRIAPDIPVIVLTGEGDIPMAVRAMREGAWDFPEKPCPGAVWSRRCPAGWTTGGRCWRRGGPGWNAARWRRRPGAVPPGRRGSSAS